jgi:hypothetical protein
VTQVLKDTATLRLIEGGEWVNVPELPSQWPSHEYQKVMNADGSPSETVVAMRIGAAGAELVRTGDHSLAQEAPRVRAMTLDGVDAPNTVPGNGNLPTPIDEEKERLGELATEVENYHVNGGNGSSRPRRRGGEGAESARRANPSSSKSTACGSRFSRTTALAKRRSRLTPRPA